MRLILLLVLCCAESLSCAALCDCVMSRTAPPDNICPGGGKAGRGGVREKGGVRLSLGFLSN